MTWYHIESSKKKKKNLVLHVRKAVYFGLPFDNFFNSNHFACGVCLKENFKRMYLRNKGFFTDCTLRTLSSQEPAKHFSVCLISKACRHGT